LVTSSAQYSAVPPSRANFSSEFFQTAGAARAEHDGVAVSS
jgi:hypothetical protein